MMEAEDTVKEPQVIAEESFDDVEVIGPGSTEIAPFDPLRRYLSEISRFTPLSRDEEHKLAVHYSETEDRETAYRLVTSNLKLVVKIAMIYHKVYRNLLDLIQEGNLGLIQAVRRFDPYRGTRLPTYAAWWIKAYILKFLLDNTRMVKIGTTNTRRKILMNLNREKRELESKGIVPTSKLLAENLGVEEEELREVEQGMSGPDISLDAPLGDENDDAHYIDTLRLMEQSVDEKIAHGEFRELLEKKFADFEQTLSERERMILTRRLIADEPETLQQLADQYQISREAIRVAEKKLVAKLKKYMIESFGDIGEIEFHLSS
ncbi:MAG TPA: sigma-70 family RNA polymerase sigma factor [Acidobacteriota bacterium]|nr:sigma-70 family RNA polymerase sigma factor [Acidobacteriota bacterium]